jgi:predicted amidohydrolase
MLSLGYGSDFALFPEFFTAPLMADYNHLSGQKLLRELARHTEAVKLRFKNLLFRITSISSPGMPFFIENGHVYNVGFLCKETNFETGMYRNSHHSKRSFHWGITGET